MDDLELPEGEALASLAKKLLLVAVIAALACLALLYIDYRLKRDIVAEADQWRREVRAHGQQPPQQWRGQQGGGHHSDNQPGPVRRSPDVPGMGGNPQPPQDPDGPRAAPIVAPGTESARPPHRGAIDG